MVDYDSLSVSNGSGDAALMHITATRAIGSMTIVVDTVANVPAKFIGTTGTLLPSGYINPATKTDFAGHISGTTLVIDSFAPGSTDLGNIAAQVVVIKPNTLWADSLVAKALVAHNIDGSLKVGAVTTDTILAANVVTTPKILDANVTKPKIDWSTFNLNMKSARNTGSITPTNTDQDLASSGLLVSFTVSAPCNAMVTVGIGLGSTADFEFMPEIRLNGTVMISFTPVAAPGFINSRNTERTITYIVPLATGVNSLSAGLSLSSFAGGAIIPGSAYISAIVFGNVTA